MKHLLAYSLVIAILSVTQLLWAQEKVNLSLSFPAPIEHWTSFEQALQSSRPDTIYHLDISKRELKRIPGKVYRFENLKALNVSGNRIKKLPKKLNRLDSLSFVDISSNGSIEKNKRLAELQT